MNFVFEHAFYCHVYHHSLRFISYKATTAKEKEHLGNVLRKFTEPSVGGALCQIDR